MKQYMVGRLVSGEQIMAELVQDTGDAYVLESPLQIKNIPVVTSNGLKETITATPLCSFTNANLYKIAKSNFIYAAELSEMFVPTYNRIVKESNEEVEVEDPREENTEMTEEDLGEIMARVEEKMKKLTQQVEKEKEEESYFADKALIRGNETKH